VPETARPPAPSVSESVRVGVRPCRSPSVPESVRQTVTMTGTIMGRWRVRSPTSFPKALRATRFRVS